MLRSLLASAVLLCIASLCSSAQSVQVNGRIELAFESEISYEHPLHDVRIQCYFTGPSGEHRMEAFWDGGRVYKVRFAPPDAGHWTWRTVCTDRMNAGLHDRTGEFTVGAYEGDDPFRAKGWPKVSEDKRYLTYGNGDPFFLLGCTAWEVSWKSYLGEVRTWLSDRRKKEFNNVQLVVLSHQRIEEFGVNNRNYVPSFIDEDMSMLNPEYFRYIDTIVTMANDSGMIVTIVPLWADMAYLYHPGPHRFTFSRKDALMLSRYVGARYGGHNVIWIVGGDNSYETPERQEFWADFGRTLDTASGGRHLATVHTNGWRASWFFFDSTAEWIDYHTYHSSHYAEASFQWLAATEGWNVDPPKPVVNGEAAYEDINHNFSDENFRLNSYHVRHAAYTSILSGALVGFPYGANGIWQWNNGDWVHSTHWPRYQVLESLGFEGSYHVSLLKRLMERYGWHRFRPRRDLLVAEDSGTYVPVAVNDHLLMAYLWRHMKSATLRLGEFGPVVEALWINPITGDSTLRDTLVLNGIPEAEIVPPDTNDWLFVARTFVPKPIDVDTVACPFGCLKMIVPPNRERPRLLGLLLEAGILEVSLWDIRGALVDRRTYTVVDGEADIPLGDYPVGHYLFQAVLHAEHGTRIVAGGQAVVR